MSTKVRLALGVLIVLGGCSIALVFGRGQIQACLGGPGITAVRCAHGSGIAPAVGPWQAMLVASLAFGALVLLPLHRHRLHALTGGAGLVLGVVVYLVIRPKVLEGPDYDGTLLSIALPIEVDVLVWWAIAGAVVGLLVSATALQSQWFARRHPGAARIMR